MRVLITGGRFIGKYLIRKLLALNYQVFILQRSEIAIPAQAVQFNGDIQNAQFVNDVIQQVQPEVIFHLAACKDRQQNLKSIRQTLEVNLMGTCNIFEACSQINTLQSIIVMGTAEEYGNSALTPFQESQRERPISGYSLSKTCQTYLCETLARIHGLPVVVLRPSIVYGPEQGLEMFLPSLISALLKGDEYRMTLGEQTRDFIYIDDLINAMTASMEAKNIFGQIINIGCGHSVKIGFIAEYIAGALGKASLLKLGAIPYRKEEIFEYKINIKKAKKLLNWAPLVSIEEGLKKTLSYYKNLKAEDYA